MEEETKVEVEKAEPVVVEMSAGLSGKSTLA